MASSKPMTESSSSAVAAGSDHALRLKLLPASSRPEALFLWRKLELELSSRRLACSSVWTDTWLNHYGSLIPHQFAVGYRQDHPCAIALLTDGVQQKAGPFTLNSCHVGTAGEPECDSVCVEYNAILAGPADLVDFQLALWKQVVQVTSCDEFRMDGFDLASIERLVEQDPHFDVVRKPSYYFDLSAPQPAGHDLLTRFRTHARSSIRRTLRNLPDTRCEWAESADRAEELFHEMVRLHQSRWNASGLPGVYASRRFHDFHLELLHRAVPLGLSTVVGVTTSNRLIGCNQVLIDENRVLLYQCGRVSATGPVSVGTVMDYLCTVECQRRGYRALDYLAGEVEHKRRMATDKIELAWAVWRRPNLKNTAIKALRHIKRASSHFGWSDSATGRAGGLATNAPALKSPSESKSS